MRPGRTRGSSPARFLACLAFAATSAAADDQNRRAGDVLRFAMPAGVLTYELWRGDHEGLWQFGKSWIVTVGGTEVLKRSTHVERPDRSDDLSFPSGHASHAFAAATYMPRRHGIEQAWPWYVAATYVGWTRVQAHRHRWVDIAGSAALAGASSWWLVSPAREQGVSWVPIVAPGMIAVEVRASW
jgi:membrane-associated phospholipid phosphatase